MASAQEAANRIVADLNQGRLIDAREGIARLLKRDGRNPAVLHLAGMVARACGDPHTAVTRLQAAFRRQPSPDTLYWLAAMLRETGALGPARKAAESLVAARGSDARSVILLANILDAEGEADAALTALTQAQGTVADGQDLIAAKAGLLVRLGRGEEAVALMTAEATHKPGNIAARYNLGVIRRDAALGDAAGAFAAVLTRQPDHLAARLNLAALQRGAGAPGEAIATLRPALTADPPRAEAWSNYLFTLQFLDHLTVAQRVDAHRQFGLLFDRPRAPPHGNQRDGERVLRVGLVSGDFRRHAMAGFLPGVLEAIDRTAFSITLYSTVAESDDLTDRYRTLADHWVEAWRLADPLLAERIERDRIDILVDLSGHTAGNRLPVFGRRPAPVQMSWLGYPFTTGLQSIDRLLLAFPAIAYACLDQVAEKAVTVLPLAGYRPLEALPDCAPPPCLARGHVTFSSFNKIDKITPETTEIWTRILQSVERSRLVIKTVDPVSPEQAAGMLARFTARGIAPDRIEIEGPSAPPAYYRRFNDVDIALDPLPYGSATTALDGLWMGVPVIGLRHGAGLAGVAAGLQQGIGLENFGAADAHAYVAAATALANDPDRLVTLRAELRARLLLSPAHDPASTAAFVQREWRSAWQGWVTAQEV